jgi:hypothetical protein
MTPDDADDADETMPDRDDNGATTSDDASSEAAGDDYDATPT